MNIIFKIRILDSNVQYYDSNDQVMILTLELKSQRSDQRISYDNLWVIRFIIQDQES